MLAENLVSSPTQCQQLNVSSCQEHLRIQHEEGAQDDVKRNAEEKVESQSDASDKDDDYDLMSEDESEDDEHTIEEDEALITREEREEELEALQKEMDLPIEELLKRYHKQQDNHLPELEPDKHSKPPKKLQESDKVHSLDEINDEQFLQDGDDDEDFVATFEETECYMDDETTLLEEEELAKAEPNDATNEIALLKTDCEIPIAELLARYKKDGDDVEDFIAAFECYVDDETTLLEEEELCTMDGDEDVTAVAVELPRFDRAATAEPLPSDHAAVEPNSDAELPDMAASHVFYEELMCPLKARVPAAKRQKIGESSRAHLIPPPLPQTQPSSASTIADLSALVIEPVVHTSASILPTPATSTHWAVDIPHTASLMRGDIPIDALVRSLLLPRDSKLYEGSPDFRPALESHLRQVAMDDTLRATRARLEAERKARSKLEMKCAMLKSQLQVLDAKHVALCTKYSELEVRRANETKEHEEALTLAVSRYRSSEAFNQDAKAYSTAHMEELVTSWITTDVGRERIAAEGELLYDVGQYTMQRDIYAVLRRRDTAFDPVPWGLPAELENPDIEASVEPMEVADGAETFPNSLCNSATNFSRYELHHDPSAATPLD